jgi:hypothetical protein
MIQRVRVRWSAAARGAPQANARRGLCRPAMLSPSPLPGDVVIHEALAAEAAHYVRHENVLSGGVALARDLGPHRSARTSAAAHVRSSKSPSGLGVSLAGNHPPNHRSRPPTTQPPVHTRTRPARRQDKFALLKPLQTITKLSLDKHPHAGK